jgi:hypothetical protein
MHLFPFHSKFHTELYSIYPMHPAFKKYIYIYICICVCMYVCMYVCKQT